MKKPSRKPPNARERALAAARRARIDELVAAGVRPEAGQKAREEAIEREGELRLFRQQSWEWFSRPPRQS